MQLQPLWLFKTKQSKTLKQNMPKDTSKNTLIDLFNLNLEELKSEMVKIGEKPFRATQIWDWIYVNNARCFSEFKNLSADLKDKLENHFTFCTPKIVKDISSKDGTRKWLIMFDGGQEVEMVFIPEENRGTLCISSQVGCTLTCTFCHTGTQRLVRNLRASEIYWQYLIARDCLAKNGDITNLVFMGMGEPLFNFDNVRNAIKKFLEPRGINFSKRRITLSTSGVVPEMIKFCDEINVGLAVSLHSVNDTLRSKIMPINNKYPLAELLKACKYYNEINSQRITFEYVMLHKVNDSDGDANDLANFILDNELNAKINLIPFNPWDGVIYKCSSRNRMMKFAQILKDRGISAPIRKTRGEDVMAACGQLKSLSKSDKLIRDK
jgi:23S rRNA (adenine2503-C2)-methyltransferase